MDDVCFSMAAAALFCASYASLPPKQESSQATKQQQTFALVTVTTQSLPYLLAIWLAQALIVKLFYR